MYMVIYSWRTHKTPKGYKYEVIQMIPRDKKTKAGQYVITKVIREGYLPTRARAKSNAQKWVKYYNSRRKK